MDKNKILKTIAILLLPLLLFFVLYVPYLYFNSEFLVDRLGCGCGSVFIDEQGNIVEVENRFNANTFTAYFWLFIALLVTAISAVLSRFIPSKKKWLKAVYVVLMFVVSLAVAQNFFRSMMWN